MPETRSTMIFHNPTRVEQAPQRELMALFG